MRIEPYEQCFDAFRIGESHGVGEGHFVGTQLDILIYQPHHTVGIDPTVDRATKRSGDVSAEQHMSPLVPGLAQISNCGRSSIESAADRRRLLRLWPSDADTTWHKQVKSRFEGTL